MSFHDEPFIPNPNMSPEDQQRAYAEYLRNQRILQAEYEQRQADFEERKNLYNQFGFSLQRAISGESIAVEDENGILIDARTGLPAASYENSPAYRFLNTLRNVNSNVEGYNIFSFFDFNNIDKNIDNLNIENSNRIHNFSGHVNLDIPLLGSESQFRQIMSIKTLREENNQNNESLLTDILVCVENLNNNRQEKYTTIRYSLSDVFTNNVFSFNRIPLNSRFEFDLNSEEFNFRIIFYAQGSYTTELFDSYEFTLRFNKFDLIGV